MLTEEQKTEFERIFNLYSFSKEIRGFRTEYSDKMCAFQLAVDILGYEFVPNGMKEEQGIEYSSYILEELGKEVIEENGEG